MASEVRITAADLRAWAVLVLEHLGVPGDQALIIADTLVEADLRGTRSHGIRLLVTYAQRIRDGVLAPITQVTVVRDSGTVVVLDGGLGFGQVAATEAVDVVSERARHGGISSVGVRETTHFGALGYFTERIARRGLIAFCFQNGPPMVPAFGGRTPIFATNPYSYAFPVLGADPIVCDAATTAVAGSKLQMAKARGDTTVPAGWSTDREGRPTTKVSEALDGYLQWSGGHKGYGIAVLVEVLAGVLSDGPFGLTEHTESPIHGRGRIAKGGLFIAIDPSAFLLEGVFDERSKLLVDQIRGSEPSTGVDQVRLPGDIEREHQVEYTTHGIPLEKEAVRALHNLADQVGVTRIRVAG